MSEELVERLSQYMPNGNRILAGHMARLFDEYTQNGVPANADSFDLDQLIGDEQIGYREKKARLIKALRDSGYFSEREMITDDSMRRREEDRLLNSSEKEKKEEEALVEVEETKARFNQALKTIAQDKPLEDTLCEVLPEMKRFHEFLEMVLCGSYCSGGIINGPAGLSKSHRVMSELQKRGIPFQLYNSHSSSLGLFELLHANKNGGVVVLDDLESIMEDKKSIGILKAASFSATGVREVTWNSTTKILAERGLPSRFVFDSKLIVITNDEYKTRNPSFQALLSRMPVFRLDFNLDSRKILVRSIISKQPMFGLSDEAKQNVLEFMEGMLDYSKVDNYNLRSVIRAMEIYKLKGEAGKPLIADLLGIDTKMRKYILIEDKAKHLSAMQRIEVWKMATGFSIQSYYNMKNKYQRDKFDENKALEKELEDIENAIEEVSRL